MSAISHACRIVRPAGTSASLPSIVSFGTSRPSRRLFPTQTVVLANSAFELRPEVPDQSLDRPGGGIAQRADGMPVDLAGDLIQHVDLFAPRPTVAHAF